MSAIRDLDSSDRRVAKPVVYDFVYDEVPDRLTLLNLNIGVNYIFATENLFYGVVSSGFATRDKDAHLLPEAGVVLSVLLMTIESSEYLDKSTESSFVFWQRD